MRRRRPSSSPLGCTAVMATGVVSLDLASDGFERLAHVLVVLAAAAWLAVLVRGELARDVAGVAATAVVGDRVAAVGWSAVAWALFAVACALWLAQGRRLLDPKPTGAAFLPTVATQSLAVLAAALGGRWLQVAGLALVGGGLVLYARALRAFNLAELRRGRGDQWVAGGALAISGLACAELATGAALRLGAVVLWVAAIAWLPALIAGELVEPRRGEPASRWSTVFPLGMYGAMSFAISELADIGWMRDFARAWTWVAVTAWILVLISIASAAAPARRRHEVDRQPHRP